MDLFKTASLERKEINEDTEDKDKPFKRTVGNGNIWIQIGCHIFLEKRTFGWF